jgi:hypothetical protein
MVHPGGVHRAGSSAAGIKVGPTCGSMVIAQTRWRDRSPVIGLTGSWVTARCDSRRARRSTLPRRSQRYVSLPPTILQTRTPRRQVDRRELTPLTGLRTEDGGVAEPPACRAANDVLISSPSSRSCSGVRRRLRLQRVVHSILVPKGGGDRCCQAGARPPGRSRHWLGPSGRSDRSELHAPWIHGRALLRLPRGGHHHKRAGRTATRLRQPLLRAATFASVKALDRHHHGARPTAADDPGGGASRSSEPACAELAD